MVKPGDVVEFKAGLHGIDAPNNLGILLDRQRRKGVPWVTIMTVEGSQEIKADHLTRRAFRQRYDGDRRDQTAVKERLQFLIQQHTGGGLVEEVDDDLAGIEVALWELACDGEPRTDETLAGMLYEDPSPLELKQVRAALDRCRRPGTGRFETAGKGDTWRAWSTDDLAAMKQAWDDLTTLRQSLISVQETDEGRSFERTEAQPELPEWVVAALTQFIEHDGVPQKDIAGIGGFGAVAAFGMDLHRQLGFLAMDWIRSTPTTRSSDYVHFLLEIGAWQPDDAVASLTRRHVNQEPFFEHVPDPDVEALADALPRPTFDPEDTREDLRHLECYTIDPPDARDFDDAVGIEPIDGGTRLWVHIADVSHYVEDGSRIDRHAKQRATSVYLPGRVLPMLPARISDDLCSLRDDGDRFAMSVAMDIREGRVEATRFARSLIRVNENLSYQMALDRAEAGQAPFTDLLELSQAMRHHRRGLALETGEIRISVDASGFEAQEKFATPATQMIETFMVAANEAVASHLGEEGTGLLYRCHPLPDREKAERYEHQMDALGFEVPMELPGREEGSLLDQLKSGQMQMFGNITIKGFDAPEPEPEPEDAADEAVGFAALEESEQDAWLAPFRAATDVLAGLPDRGLAEILTYKLLASMGKAYYTPQNEGHFGLASSHYCHFTSPIRRYPDLVVHRNLKWLIENPEKAEEAPHPPASLETMCDHCSDQEQAAAKLERRLKASCLVLASMHGEDVFSDAEARITGITPTRVYLDVGGIDASVANRDLPGGPFEVDEWESMLFQQGPADLEPNVRARLGDRITVHLAGRDVAAGKTDARVVSWD